MHRINPTSTPAWKELESLSNELSNKHLVDIVSTHTRKFKYEANLKDFRLNYMRNHLDDRVLDAFERLFDQTKLAEAIEDQFNGKKINETEGRAVLHTALRKNTNTPFILDGENISKQIEGVLSQMEHFSNGVIKGDLKGYSGKLFTDIVNIGIGGSDLGPLMVYEALNAYRKRGLKAHFVSNVDGSHLARTLQEINPETTLFIVASKTFTTQETMANAHSAREWFLSNGGALKDIELHFAALSTNIPAAEDFGIHSSKIFGFWDWVGGRYSVWSAIGLSLCCTLGYETFEKMLRGAEEMDEHFRHSTLRENIPMLLAAIGIWYTNFMKYTSHAILPYDQNLSRLAAYLQQADMESNGKSVDRNGEKVNYETGTILWGEPGTNGQHAFYQLMHQGTPKITSDFLASANTHYPLGNQHELLLANFLAQPQALMHGLSKEQVQLNMAKEGKDQNRIKQLTPYRTFEGNRPSNILIYSLLDPIQVGRIIAMYEHKIFVQGCVWNIYSYDQWGVELGKKIATQVLDEMVSGGTPNSDPITTRLIQNLQALRQ
jgi:glucose-6-phosphate isomerase